MAPERRYMPLIFGIVFVGVLQLLVFIRGEDAYVVIHDNLDSELTYLQALKQEDLLLKSPEDARVTTIMNGLPRAFMRSPYHLTPMLFYLFPAFMAYVLNKLLVHIIAFIGMYLLLTRYFEQLPGKVSFFLSLIFSTIGFYHVQYGISVAGQPLLLYAFLNILNNKHAAFNWIILLLFPFFSFLGATVPFVVPALLLVALLNRSRQTSAWKPYLFGLALLCLGYLVTEWQLIIHTLQSGEELSHRVEFSHPENRTFSLGSLIDYVRYTHYHTGIVKTSGIWFLIAMTFFARKKFTRSSKFMLLTIILIGILHLNYDWIKADILQPMGLSIMNFSRFYFLLPTLWMILLADLMSQFRWSSHWTKMLFATVLIWVGTDVVKNEKEISLNAQLITGSAISEPTYRQFFATDLFDTIKATLITSEDTRPNVLSLGMFPNIALYNGLPVLDSYQNNYPLRYKYQFRKIISKELSKSEKLRKYFDHWGSRCYLMSSEIGKDFMIAKNASKRVTNLEIDLDAIQRLKGTHILSALEIENAKALQLEFKGTFESEESYWKIWLYKLPDQT